MEKMTKRDILNEMLTIDVIAENEVYAAFINKELEALDKRAEQAKARALKKARESDMLRREIFETLTDDWQTVNDIVTALGREDVTPAKVINRLASLINNDHTVEKAEVTVENGDTKRKVMAYRLTDDNEVAED